MSQEAFDESLEAAEQEGVPVTLPALFTLKKCDFDDKKVFAWCKNALSLSRKLGRDREEDINEHFALYKGISHQALGTPAQYGSRDRLYKNASPNQDTQMVINHMYALVTNLVSRMKRYGQKAAVLPANSDEPNDLSKAESVQKMADYVEYTNKFDLLTERIHTNKYVAGEGYLFVEWDPDKAAPTKKKSKEPIGDICLRVPSTKNVWVEPNSEGNFEKSRWIIERRYEDIDELKHDYEDKEEYIKHADSKNFQGDEYAVQSDTSQFEDEKRTNTIPVYYLWHKASKYLKGGRYIVFTEHGVLENGDNPYDHGGLPCIRLSGIDVDGEVYGHALFAQGKSLNNALNNLYSIIYSSQAKHGKPHWLIHDTANVKKEMLDNNGAMIRWEGQYKPELAQWNNTPQEVFQLTQDLTERLQQIMGVFGVSRGDPPSGIRAGIALQFLNEQENELFNSDVKKYKEFVKQMWKLIIDVMAQFYDKSDKRLLQIFGENNAYLVEEFDPKVFSTPFDIRIQDTGDLPDSKAAKTQYVLDIDEKRPLPDDWFFEALGMAVPDAYVNEKSIAKRAADLENSKFMKGEEVYSPEPWEDLLSHWNRHMVAAQSPQFRLMSAEDPRKQGLLDHIAATEMLMLDKAFFKEDLTRPKNPAMVEALGQLPNFPAVYVPPEPPPPPPPAPPMDPNMAPPMDPGMMPPMDPMMAPPLPPEMVSGGLPPEILDPLTGAPLALPPEEPLPPMPPPGEI